MNENKRILFSSYDKYIEIFFNVDTGNENSSKMIFFKKIKSNTRYNIEGQFMNKKV